MWRWGKQVLKRTPLLGSWLSKFAQERRVRTMKPRSTEEIFSNIVRNNGWVGQESVSGPGSDTEQTARISALLPALWAEYHVHSLLDIPSGDFHWMRGVNLQGISYTGADVVRELVAQNQKYATETIAFRQLNLLADPLPKVDLIFCRDCLVHFSFDDIFRALRSIAASGSEYLLTTTFPTRSQNVPIKTGDWQPLNLEQEPFVLPPPIKLINEGCTEGEGKYADKSLGLWKITDLEACLTKHRA